MENTTHYPPPWHLKGKGFIIPFLGKENILLEKGFISEEDKEFFRGGLGAVMLVNYESSNVGPYYELLFIPGDFSYDVSGKSKLYKRITKIFVSSLISIQEGRLNWAIPKEFANFKWNTNGNNTEISVSTKDGEIFLEAEFTKKYFYFPLTTKIYPVSLLQKTEAGKLISTKFSGSGKGKFAAINKWSVNEKYFVDINKVAKFSIGLSADEFNIVFPIPKIF
jgi:hypothetical protein